MHTIIKNQKREELEFGINFGLFNLVELGIMELRKEDASYLMGNARLLLSRESGSIPGFSIGVENFGEKIQGSKYRYSFYGVISKQFNLPVIHLLYGHLGAGNNKYLSDVSIGKYLHGMFVGFSKEIALSSLSSNLYLMCELTGKDINAGLKYAMDSGLLINVAAGKLNSDIKELEYHIGIGFTNAPIMKGISQSSELAKRAVEIANEAKSDNDKIK